MSFGIKVAPEVRISASRRGLRTGFGDRPAAVHLGSGRSGAGSFSYWAGISAREHHPQGRAANPPVALAALAAQIRDATRPPQIAEAARTEAAIVALHTEPYPAVVAPVVAPPHTVDDKAVATELRSQALLGAGRWRVRGRRQAGREASGAATEEVAQRQEQLEAEYQATRNEAVGRFDALMANEPEDVLGALEAFFERNEIPAGPIDCDGDVASVVLRLPAPSVVPDSKPVISRKGKPALQPRTGAERHQLYLGALASTVIAVVRQTLATAPALGGVRILVFRPTDAQQQGRPLEAVYVGSFDAGVVGRTAWADVDPVAEIAGVRGRLLCLSGGDRKVTAVDLADEPDVAALLDTLGAALHPGPAA
ncbi:MAG: hypothetical protein M3137_06940 [Actinomycetota bacterium]|nr:hypothetical protein [Actinomycetota bacterium]